MKNGYEDWLSEVKNALTSINMPMSEWQDVWPFDFRALFHAGTPAVTAASQANRFWWQMQNRTLKQECKKNAYCWLPNGHKGSCERVESMANK